MTITKSAGARACSGAAMAFAALSLAGCATPSLTPPDHQVAVPDGWSQLETAGAADLTAYWAQLGDPVLTELVERAAANNLDIAQGAARLEQARAQLRFARAGFLPQVGGSAGVQRDVGDFADDDFRFSLGADVSWEADLFGRIGGEVAATGAELAAAGYSLGDVQRAVVAQVALQVIAARASALHLAVARGTLALQDDNLQIARWRVQAGLVSSLDVEQARSQRAQVAATIPALESDLAATANAISTLIGEPPGRVLALLSTAGEVPEPPALVGAEAPAEVLRRRPDVRAAELSLLASTARIGVARAQLLPLVRLTGNFGTAPASIGSLGDILTGSLFGGVSQLIFDGGRTRAQIASAEAAAQGALAAWRQRILTALEEVESASADLDAARRRVGAYAEALDAADSAALLARSQYRAGLTDFQTLLTTENQLLSARNAVVAAEAERAGAFVRLSQALGGGWSPQDLTPSNPDGIRP